MLAEEPNVYLDTIIKLASIGAAGICIAGIILAYLMIRKLPKNASKELMSLIQFFIKACIFMALICTLSGAANAYFNQNKVVEAQENAAKVQKQNDALKTRLNAEVEKFNRNKLLLNNEINTLQRTLRQIPNVPNNFRSSVDSISAISNRMSINREKIINIRR